MTKADQSLIHVAAMRRVAGNILSGVNPMTGVNKKFVWAGTLANAFSTEIPTQYLNKK